MPQSPHLFTPYTTQTNTNLQPKPSLQYNYTFTYSEAYFTSTPILNYSYSNTNSLHFAYMTAEFHDRPSALDEVLVELSLLLQLS